jgi:hypothetical protein
MQRLQSSMAWMTVVAAVSAAACTFDLRENGPQTSGVATEPNGDEAPASDADDGTEESAAVDRGVRADSGSPTADSGGAQPSKKKTCYPDQDGDGYPSASASIVTSSATCPASYILERADAKFDCNDDDADVHPDQQKYFSEPSSPGTYDFDYDCDGASTSNRRAVVYCSVLPPAECSGAVEVLGYNAATIGAVGCGSKVKGVYCAFNAQGTCSYTTNITDVQFSCR